MDQLTKSSQVENRSTKPLALQHFTFGKLIFVIAVSLALWSIALYGLMGAIR